MNDIADIQPVEARAVEIRHPSTDEPIGLTVHLRPLTDPKVEAAVRKRQNARLSSRNQKTTAESLQELGTATIIAAMDRWEWADGVTFEGEQLEMNETNIRRVFGKLKFVRAQLDQELGDESSFFTN